MRKGLVVLALLASVTAASGAIAAERGLVVAQATPESAPADQKLVGLAAWNALVGNSVSGKEDGKDVIEFYAPNGTAKSMAGNEISTGTWALVGDTICFKYPDEETECYKLEVAGTNATFTDRKGTGTRYEILKGNPKGL